MKNTFMTIVITTLLTLITLSIPVSYAAETTSNSPTTTEIVNELVKYENPYYGYDPMDFDFNNDGQIDVFDMIILKQKLVAGDPEVTMATAVKLESYLLGKPNSSLSITKTPSKLYNTPSEHTNDLFKNLTSNDFRFVHAVEENIMLPNGDVTPAVNLYFLSVDEYVKESVLIINFCNNVNEFDEFVTATKDKGFYIGIKDGMYTLAVKSAITITATPSTNSNEKSTNSVTVEIA